MNSLFLRKFLKMASSIKQHRSIRKYKNTPIQKELLSEILSSGTRASTTGNMQVYSIIATTDTEIKEQLSPCQN